MNRSHPFRWIIIAAVISILALPVSPLTAAPPQPSPRPKVALVLSGGAALGFAHIGVLEKLEELGIPIDLIVGTSMGSLVGSLYAAGYSPSELHRLSQELDWSEMFSAPDSFLTYLTQPVIDNHKSIISFNFDNQGVGKSLGIIPDQQIITMLSRLLLKVSDIRDFDGFDIPFRCVAVDLISGEQRVFKKGFIVSAIRASMSIPGVFAPYPIDGSYYIDGGVLNNLPIDVAVAEGADIIIAVNVDIGTPDTIDGFSSAVDVVSRAASLLIGVNEKQGLAHADILIEPDLEGLDRAMFWRYDDFIERGRAAADQAEVALRQLADRISLSRELEPRDPERAGSYGMIPDATIVGVSQVRETRVDVPIQLFAATVGQQTNEQTVDGVVRRIHQVITSGNFESISFGLSTHQGEGLGQYLLELNPVSSNRGKNSLRAGFEFTGAFTGSALTGGWYLSPAFTTSLTFTEFLGTNSYLNIDLLLEQALETSLELHLPIGSTWYLSPHLTGGEKSFTQTVGSQELNNIFSFLEIGQESGLSIGKFMQVGLDVNLRFQWLRTGLPGEEVLVDTEIKPMIAPTFTWTNFKPSRFVHEGVRTELALDIPLIASADWYHCISLTHEQYVPISLESTFFYDLLFGSYRGDIETPWVLFDVGGWDGVPGYLPEALTSRDAVLAGIGLRQRFGFISEAIGMDTYLVGRFRLGNGWDVFPAPPDITFRFGGELGVGFDTILGELILGAGMNQQGDLAWYLMFN